MLNIKKTQKLMQIISWNFPGLSISVCRLSLFSGYIVPRKDKFYAFILLYTLYWGGVILGSLWEYVCPSVVCVQNFCASVFLGEVVYVYLYIYPHYIHNREFLCLCADLYMYVYIHVYIYLQYIHCCIDCCIEISVHDHRCLLFDKYLL